MKKYEVLQPFTDKDTFKEYAVVHKYESDNPERVAFLREKGYLGKEVEEKPAETEQTPVQKALEGNVDEVKANVDTLTVDELKEALEIEQKQKNRKGVTDHINDLLKEETNESGEA